jgi:hypothetical protein
MFTASSPQRTLVLQLYEAPATPRDFPDLARVLYRSVERKQAAEETGSPLSMSEHRWEQTKRRSLTMEARTSIISTSIAHGMHMVLCKSWRASSFTPV